MPVSAPREYLSDTEFRFHENQADAIIRTVTYPRKEFCQSVIWFPPSQHDPIRQSIKTPFQRSSNTGLGPLERLPPEVLYDIFLRLDVQSLFNFGQTNVRSREMVYSLKQYQMVVSHGLNLVCALLRTGVATSVSLLDCYRALCTKACAICNEFAGFISLLTWIRCCYRCFQMAPETQMYSLTYARRRFQLTKTDLAQLKSFKSLPGTYKMKESTYKSRVTIVSAQQALFISDQQPLEPTQVAYVTPAPNEVLNFMGSCALPYYDAQTGKVEDGVSCAGCQLAVEKGIIGARLDSWSLACEACRKVYARDEFLEHFKWCEQAQRLWNTSDEGESQPPELPVAARLKGHFAQRE